MLGDFARPLFSKAGVWHGLAMVILSVASTLWPTAAIADDFFVADADHGTILKVTIAGEQTTFATGFDRPQNMALNYAGDLFVSDSVNGRIRRITKTGVASTFITGLNSPADLAFDSAGNLFVLDGIDGSISKVTPKGQISIFVAGTNPSRHLRGLAFGPDGNLYSVTDVRPSTILKITPDGQESIFAYGPGGPGALAFDADGYLYITSHQSRTVTVYSSTGEASTMGNLVQSMCVAFDSKNNLFKAGLSTIDEISPDGDIIQSFAKGIEFSDFFVCVPGLLKPGRPPDGAGDYTTNADATIVLAGVVPALATLVRANNDFALELNRSLGSKPDDNFYFSPAGITSALTLAWVGAKGQTAGELASALQLTSFAPADILPAFQALQQRLAQAGELAASGPVVSTTWWSSQDSAHPILPAFLAIAKSDFKTAVFPVDFKDQSAAMAAQINSRIADETGNALVQAVQSTDLNGTSRLVLINAATFKGGWRHPFDSAAPTQAAFRLAGGGSATVELLNGIFATGYADIKDGAVPLQMLSLEYDQHVASEVSNRGSMASPSANPGFSLVFILPRRYQDLPTLEKSLTTDQLAAWLGRLDSRRMNIFLPKFQLAKNYHLKSFLPTLGITRAFADPLAHPNDSTGADFSGLNGRADLFFSQIIQQSLFSLDEQGSGAAAAGAIQNAPNNPNLPPPVLFLADHPFLFFIRENSTGSILFLGRLAHPE